MGQHNKYFHYFQLQLGVSAMNIKEAGYLRRQGHTTKKHFNRQKYTLMSYLQRLEAT